MQEAQGTFLEDVDRRAEGHDEHPSQAEDRPKRCDDRPEGDPDEHRHDAHHQADHQWERLESDVCSVHLDWPLPGDVPRAHVLVIKHSLPQTSDPCLAPHREWIDLVGDHHLRGAVGSVHVAPSTGPSRGAPPVEDHVACESCCSEGLHVVRVHGGGNVLQSLAASLQPLVPFLLRLDVLGAWHDEQRRREDRAHAEGFLQCLDCVCAFRIRRHERDEARAVGHLRNAEVAEGPSDGHQSHQDWAAALLHKVPEARPARPCEPLVHGDAMAVVVVALLAVEAGPQARHLAVPCDVIGPGHKPPPAAAAVAPIARQTPAPVAAEELWEGQQHRRCERQCGGYRGADADSGSNSHVGDEGGRQVEHHQKAEEQGQARDKHNLARGP
mmetsp:Transcript_63401/g.159895  ORF Transcript_63401/g.159895 Transcript_63401/m.159895 type:complete len:384 (+) Transcript_63401:643-1794(+)